MRRRIITLVAILTASVSMMAMSSSTVRKETRFLTDKMAYELKLSDGQYNDAYEINYDFIYSIRNIMDDVMRGDDDAQERYYRALDTRNDDLRYVLNDGQYRRFLGIEYFYRPIAASGRTWTFRVYNIYPNRLSFFFGIPTHYNTYSGAHCRAHYNNVSFYSNRYNHQLYRGQYRTTTTNVYVNNRRADFGVSSRVIDNGRSESRRTNNNVFIINNDRHDHGHGRGHDKHDKHDKHDNDYKRSSVSVRTTTTYNERERHSESNRGESRSRR